MILLTAFFARPINCWPSFTGTSSLFFRKLHEITNDVRVKCADGPTHIARVQDLALSSETSITIKLPPSITGWDFSGVWTRTKQLLAAVL